MAALWFSLAGASQGNKEINHLNNNTSELLDVRILPFISIQVKNIFVLLSDEGTISPSQGLRAAGMSWMLHGTAQLCCGSLLTGGERCGWLSDL